MRFFAVHLASEVLVMPLNNPSFPFPFELESPQPLPKSLLSPMSVNGSVMIMVVTGMAMGAGMLE